MKWDRPDAETGRVEPYYIKGMPRDVYFIPFTKTTVDKILNSEHPFGADSINITDKDKILYYGKFSDVLGIPSFRCMDYTYEQFTNTPEWKRFLELAIRPGGPAGRVPNSQQPQQQHSKMYTRREWNVLSENGGVVNKNSLLIFLYFAAAATIMHVNPHNRTHKIDPQLRDCISELESLGVEPKRINEFNDKHEMEQLVDNIKLNLYEDYKSEELGFRV